MRYTTLATILVVFLLAMTGCVRPAPETGFTVQGVTNLDALEVGTLTARGAVYLPGETTLGTLIGSSIYSNSVQNSGWLAVSPASNITISAGGVITPTASFHRVLSASSLTCSTTRCIAPQPDNSEGALLILQNGNAANTITIDGTGGTVECKTDIVLGAKDVLTLIWSGEDWNCLSLYDNS